MKFALGLLILLTMGIPCGGCPGKALLPGMDNNKVSPASVISLGREDDDGRL
jgi:hypothetical protein